MTEELEIIRKNIDETCSNLYLDCEMARLDYPFEKMIEYQNRYGGNFPRFVKGLYDRGITYKELVQEWKYVGGDGRSRDENAPCHITSHQRYFEQVYGNSDYPEWEGYCVCEHIIIENCYMAKRKDINTMIIIGNCCIKRFMPNSGRGRTCQQCGNGHRNSKRNLCNLCDPAKNKPKGRRGRPHRIT